LTARQRGDGRPAEARPASIGSSLGLRFHADLRAEIENGLPVTRRSDSAFSPREALDQQSSHAFHHLERSAQ
jgi:hypothetical protein